MCVRVSILACLAELDQESVNPEKWVRCFAAGASEDHIFGGCCKLGVIHGMSAGCLHVSMACLP